jgi:hypothetical protein
MARHPFQGPPSRPIPRRSTLVRLRGRVKTGSLPVPTETSSRLATSKCASSDCPTERRYASEPASLRQLRTHNRTKATDDEREPGSLITSHIRALLGVKPSRRLVEEQHRWSREQTGREVQAPAHPARVPLHDAVSGVGETELVQQLCRPGSRVGATQSAQTADHHEVLRRQRRSPALSSEADERDAMDG